MSLTFPNTSQQYFLKEKMKGNYKYNHSSLHMEAIFVMCEYHWSLSAHLWPFEVLGHILEDAYAILGSLLVCK